MFNHFDLWYEQGIKCNKLKTIPAIISTKRNLKVKLK